MEWYKIQLSDGELKDIENEEQIVSKTQLLKRLQTIKLKSQKWKNQDLSKFFWVCPDTITNWIKAYKQDGINWLLNWEYKWKISQLTEANKEQLKSQHKDKPFDTAKEAKAYIKKEFGMTFHLHWVQKLLKKNFDFHTKKQD